MSDFSAGKASELFCCDDEARILVVIAPFGLCFT